MVAFSIALNQAQSAISERRAILTVDGVVPAAPVAVTKVTSLQVVAKE
jgi:hypothetical protein